MAIHTPRLRQTKSVDFTMRLGPSSLEGRSAHFCLGIVNETSWPRQAVSYEHEQRVGGDARDYQTTIADHEHRRRGRAARALSPAIFVGDQRRQAE